jgi:hypothetical protein
VGARLGDAGHAAARIPVGIGQHHQLATPPTPGRNVSRSRPSHETATVKGVSWTVRVVLTHILWDDSPPRAPSSVWIPFGRSLGGEDQSRSRNIYYRVAIVAS